MNAAVVYWSGTGNTEAMAQAVAEGIQAAGGTAEVCEVGQTDADTISKFDKIALGCPSMGAEQLEDSESGAFVEELEPMISGKQLLCLGLTAGVTESGCVTGAREWKRREHI